MTRSRPPQENAALLRALQQGGVEFVVIGGVAAVDLSLLDEPIERLKSFRLFLIQTSLGRLDVLRDVTPIGRYGSLEHVPMTVSGVKVPVITRRQLITVKRSLSRPKDHEVALELELAEEAERESNG